jgi:hypothetical protein
VSLGLEHKALVMKRLIIKGKDRMWPTVIWQGSRLVVYYLGEDESDVKVKETTGIDFEEFFLHLDKGGSIFVTVKPENRMPGVDPLLDTVASELHDYA